MFSAAIKGNSTSSRCLPDENTSERLEASELATDLLSGEDPAGAGASQVCGSPQGRGTMNRHLERREQLKRLSVDSGVP
ncbi:hypothetical protein INR49_001321, partial [Caranx melampygus]